MDRVAKYQVLLKQAFAEILAEVPEEQGIRTEAIFDEEKGHYEIMQIGWEGNSRVHGSLAHCDIRNDKIYVEHDGTDFGIADFLVAHGVSNDEIVLGYKHPTLRPYTKFAVV